VVHRRNIGTGMFVPGRVPRSSRRSTSTSRRAPGRASSVRREQVHSQVFVRQPDAEDLEPMLKLFRLSDHTTFDLERKVLMFANLKTK
jgi:hypothetical protein